MKSLVQILFKYTAIMVAACCLYWLCYLIGCLFHEKKYCGGICFYNAITFIVTGTAVTSFIILSSIGDYFKWSKTLRIILKLIIVVVVLGLMHSTIHPLRYYLISISILSVFPLEYIWNLKAEKTIENKKTALKWLQKLWNSPLQFQNFILTFHCQKLNSLIWLLKKK